MSTALPVPEDTSVLGAHIRDGGTSFGLWAPRAHRVELALVDEDGPNSVVSPRHVVVCLIAVFVNES